MKIDISENDFNQDVLSCHVCVPMSRILPTSVLTVNDMIQLFSTYPVHKTGNYWLFVRFLKLSRPFVSFLVVSTVSIRGGAITHI